MRSRSPALVAASAALLVLTSCARGSADSPGSPELSATPSATATGSAAPTVAGLPADLPRADVSLADTVAAFAEAVRTGECARIGPFVTTRQRVPSASPGSTPAPAECTQLERFLSPLASFTPTAQQEFGTAAVVDGSLNGAVATTLWVLDADRRWRIDPTAYVYPTAEDPDVHSVGTAPRPGNRFAENARAWVAAWRSGECAAVFRLTDPFSAFVADNGGTEEALCTIVTESFTGDGIGRMLAENPDAVPVELGAVDQYGFSLLRAADGSLFTIVSIVQATNASPEEREGHDNYAVYNIYRSRAADQAAPAAPPAAPATDQPSGLPHAPS